MDSTVCDGRIVVVPPCGEGADRADGVRVGFTVGAGFSLCGVLGGDTTPRRQVGGRSESIWRELAESLRPVHDRDCHYSGERPAVDLSRGLSDFRRCDGT